jgi:hypothetical protein
VEAMTMRLTADQDRALARLRVHSVVAMDELQTVAELNAMRDLTKRGLARFARFKSNCGYVLVQRQFLTEVA